MKRVHRLTLILIAVLVALPLVIVAQDKPHPTPHNELTEDDIPPIPTLSDELTEDDIPPIPTLSDELTEDDIPPIPTLSDELTEDDIPPIPTLSDELTEDDIPPIPTLSDELTEDDIPPIPTLSDELTTPTRTPTPRPTLDTTSIVNGMWVLDPNESGYNKTGDCQILGGDNDGPSGQGEPLEELPHVPACMTSDQQWLTVDGNGPFPLVMPRLYSQQEMSRELLTTDGTTTGTINVTTDRGYRIVSPSEIQFYYGRKEQGGCSTESTVVYKLMEPNELVCSGVVMTPIVTATVTTIPTAKPGETPIPMPTIVPPVKEGRYIIDVPGADDMCSANQLPPSNTVDVSYTPNQDMFINFGGSSYTLFWDGSDYYSFQRGNQFSLSLITYEGGNSFAWSNAGCFINSPLMQEGAPTPTPVPVEPTTAPETSAASVAGSTYSATVDAPDYLCAPENLPLLPDMSSAVLTANADDTYTLSFGGSDYVLTNFDGIYGYTLMGDDGSMLTISMNGFYNGQGMGNFGIVTADGKTCFAQVYYDPI